ncbi:transposase [Streptomyces sp. NPDC020794]|uniref:transposase n=1 Tax=unclassified Streptomyces TaxID=2593676 RepID=UPI0036E05290
MSQALRGTRDLPIHSSRLTATTGTWHRLTAHRGINLRLHLTAGMREFIEANAEWLTVFHLPAYAPDLNPQEGIWSLVKREIGNLAAADLGQITRSVKRRLKRIQYRPELVDGCLAATGLMLETGVSQSLQFA